MYVDRPAVDEPDRARHSIPRPQSDKLLGGRKAATISGLNEEDLFVFIDNVNYPSLSGDLSRHAGRNDKRRSERPIRPIDRAVAPIVGGIDDASAKPPRVRAGLPQRIDQIGVTLTTPPDETHGGHLGRRRDRHVHRHWMLVISSASG